MNRYNIRFILSLFLGFFLSSLNASARAAINITQPPDHVRVITETATVEQASSDQANVTFANDAQGLQVRLAAPNSAVKSIELHWPGSFGGSARFLGDTWERAYADLGWRLLDKAGAMPWYFLVNDANHTDGYGVMTGPGAMCHWAGSNGGDDAGITLVADVRCGGSGVQLGNRTLNVCTIVMRIGKDNEDAFDAAAAFCRQMCPHSRTPKMPVYGFNDWNSTYGHNTAEHFERDAAVLASLAPDGPNRPFMVVDDGWQANRQGGHTPDNPWDRTNAKFGSSMADLSAKIKQLHAHPGLWYRPLEAWSSAPKEQKLRGSKDVFDPSVPAVRQRIVEDMRRFHGWGIEFVKHDFSTIEMLGKWGKDLGGKGTNDGWAFADRSRTTAEIILDFYRAIREGGGDEMTIDGCNTVSHLSAGIFELARIGDDTSGEEWKRNWQYGVNALAFRAPQQGAFYAADPDMVALAKAGAIPWEKNKQWLQLASHSGTVLFISWKVELMDDPVKAAIKEAYAAAAKSQPVARPLDWMDTKVPTRWMLDGKEAEFAW
jgi:alpha-galactosidase